MTLGHQPARRPLLKLVADSNFYIAAALKEGFSSGYLAGEDAKYMDYQFYASEAILYETQATLEKPNFGLSRDIVVDDLVKLRKQLIIVYPTQKLDIVRDSKDNMILECAVEVPVDVIISFDKDLLSLKEFNGVKILHPSELKYLLPLK